MTSRNDLSFLAMKHMAARAKIRRRKPSRGGPSCPARLQGAVHGGTPRRCPGEAAGTFRGRSAGPLGVDVACLQQVQQGGEPVYFKSRPKGGDTTLCLPANSARAHRAASAQGYGGARSWRRAAALPSDGAFNSSNAAPALPRRQRLHQSPAAPSELSPPQRRRNSCKFSNQCLTCFSVDASSRCKCAMWR